MVYDYLYIFIFIHTMSSKFQKLIAYRQYIMNKRESAIQRFNDAVRDNDIKLIERRYKSLMTVELTWSELNDII